MLYCFHQQHRTHQIAPEMFWYNCKEKMKRKGATLLLDNLLYKKKGLDDKQWQSIADVLLGGSSSSSSNHASRRSLYWKGVQRGRYHRINLSPTKPESPSQLPKLTFPGSYPHQFKPVVLSMRLNTTETSSSFASRGAFRYEQIMAWFKENWSIVVLNLGSVATLVGFTRSDLLELRMLSVTGSMGNVIYISAKLRYGTFQCAGDFSLPRSMVLK